MLSAGFSFRVLGFFVVGFEVFAVGIRDVPQRRSGIRPNGRGQQDESPLYRIMLKNCPRLHTLRLNQESKLKVFT